MNDDQVRFVCATLDGFDLHPIIYLRKLDEFVQGMYSTDVIFNGEVGTIADYLTRVRTPLDYKKIIDPWARYADRLPAVRFYSPLLSKHANIVDDIAANMGLALTGLSPNVFERVNVGSWPWYVVEVSRQMNQCGTPSDLVVKFAFIIREIAGPEAHYSLMLPSNATLLNQAGLESAERLQEVGLISWVPSFLRENSVVDTDENWLDTHAAEHAALTCVLQQMSNVVGQQIS